MYIEPNTNIRLLKNVPLDNTYEHTIYFENESSQIQYFVGLTKYNLTNYTYQRVHRGVARVGIQAENLYDCNYMMFQNTAFGNKWFYAFITGVEYVNNGMSEVSFEMDVMQTWFFEHEPQECFVEREHSTTDVAGDNIIDEGLNLGKYEHGRFYRSGLFDKWCILVQSPYTPVAGTTPPEVEYNPAGKYNDVISGAKCFVIRDGAPTGDVPLVEALQTYLDACNNLDGATDAIVSISMYPEEFTTTNYHIPEGAVYRDFTVAKPTKVGDYTPRNKKLLTYPFNYLGIRNGNGDISEFRYELFNQHAGDPTDCTFRVYGDANTITFVCFPTRYNDTHNSDVVDFGEFASMGDIPLVSYPTDTYKIWYSQNKVSLIGNTALASVGSAIAGLTSDSGKGVARGVAGSVGTVIGALIQNENHKHVPNMVHGTAGSGIGIASATQDFMNVNIHINIQHARMIDDFFDMYGYATKRLKKPNRNVRPHWCYCKTVRADITGSVPADDMRKLCSIYDNGITFWKHGNEVGNYSLNNAPT